MFSSFLTMELISSSLILHKMLLTNVSGIFSLLGIDSIYNSKPTDGPSFCFPQDHLCCEKNLFDIIAEHELQWRSSKYFLLFLSPWYRGWSFSASALLYFTMPSLFIFLNAFIPDDSFKVRLSATFFTFLWTVLTCRVNFRVFFLQNKHSLLCFWYGFCF